jgi:cyclopropane-fatty-acyl-phospholipid synthase
VNDHDRSCLALEPDIPRNVRIARWLLFRLLSGLQEGSLTIRDGAQVFHFGDTSAELRAEVRIVSPGVYWRLLTGGSLAAAEAWMDGEWETHQLTSLLQMVALNSSVLGRLECGFRLLGNPAERLRHWMRRNHRVQARENIAAHYDLGNAFYRTFWMKSCSIPARCFPTVNRIWSGSAGQNVSPVRTTGTETQRSSAGNRYGLGWRWRSTPPVTMAVVLPPPRCRRQWATERIARSGLQDRVQVLLCDYRDLTGEYDKLVSVEMIEAVGKRYLPAFFRTCQARLRSGGKMTIQAITIR